MSSPSFSSGDEYVPAGHKLVLPFVSVQSKGGPHDDLSFVAGFEMGYLDAALCSMRMWANAVRWTIHAVNRDQADLIAMQYGYTIRVIDDSTEGWLGILLTKADS